MRRLFRILGAATFALAALAPRGALAFCRSTTCSDADCPRDADNCKTTGHPLFWSTSCVGFSIQKDGTANLSASTSRSVIVDSFVTWTDLACKGGGQADIGFGELDDAACHVAQYNPSGPNANVVMFQDDRWTYTDVSDTLAKTTVSFDTTTGEIWDADIELNFAYNELTVGDDHVVYDLQSILTHEIGHFIGLDHSLDDAATMNADYMIGTISQRTLAPDDVSGACAAYPPARAARCSLTPKGGFVSACTGDAAPKDPGGCAMARGEGSNGLGALVLVAGAAIVIARRRRRTAAAIGALALTAIALSGACGKDSPQQTLCDPRSVIFCMCPDGEAGSKTCDADGNGFDACKLQSTGEACPNHLPTTSSSGGSSTGGSGGGGGSSTSSSGGAGGSVASGGGGGGTIGACPGIPATVSMGNDTTLGGDTAQGSDLEDDRCGGQGAPEIAYEVTPASSGTLVVTASGIGQTNPVLYARTGDCETGVSLGCSDATAGGGTEVLSLEAVASTPIWIFVDGAAATSGSYSLNLHLQGGVPGDTCPGVAIALDPGDTITAGGDTSIASPNYKGTGACSASGTREIVYAVTPSADGMLTVKMDPGFDAQLYARSGSCTSSTTGTQVGCSDNPGSGTEETITFAATGGTTYSVFADGAPGEFGPYTISFELQ